MYAVKQLRNGNLKVKFSVFNQKRNCVPRCTTSANLSIKHLQRQSTVNGLVTSLFTPKKDYSP